jgi:hypothetical protein
MATTEEDCEQPDYPTHGSLSVKPGGSYMIREREKGTTGAKRVCQILNGG